jgi:hypothetical protein
VCFLLYVCLQISSQKTVLKQKNIKGAFALPGTPQVAPVVSKSAKYLDLLGICCECSCVKSVYAAGNA